MRRRECAVGGVPVEWGPLLRAAVPVAVAPVGVGGIYVAGVGERQEFSEEGGEPGQSWGGRRARHI